MSDIYLVEGASNAFGALLFIFAVGFIPEPWRQRAMALMLAFAGGVFLHDPTNSYGVLLAVAIAAFALSGFWRYWMLGLGWLLHTAWDINLHVHGHGLAGGDPMGAFGCAVFDPIIGIWLVFGAPSVKDGLVRLSARRVSQ